MSDLFFRIIRHLLPSGLAWKLAPETTARKLVQGLTQLPADARKDLDLIFLDVLPEDTRNLAEYERQFGLRTGDLTDTERRQRLRAEWSILGGQDPRYLQDVVQAAGFDLWLHEWWVPEDEVTGVMALDDTSIMATNDTDEILYLDTTGKPFPHPRNPTTALGGTSKIRAGVPEARAGNAVARAGNVDIEGFLLVNRGLAIKEVSVNSIADKPGQWRYILYWGGQNFPDAADVPATRRRELEELLLKICPAQQWLGMIVRYT